MMTVMINCSLDGFEEYIKTYHLASQILNWLVENIQQLSRWK